MERDEVKRLVRAAIERLPDSYRTVLLLRDIEEFDTAATGEALGLSRAAVKTRLHRARQALRQLLDEHFRLEQAEDLPNGAGVRASERGEPA
jgi:RNA polymerase sigma-70 factor (ECF subfamily)